MAEAVMRYISPEPKSTHLSMAGMQATWRERIMKKFQNTRNKKDFSLIEVSARKNLKSKDKEAKNKQSSDAFAAYGVINYLPSRAESEDDASILKHKEWLKLEKRKLRQDLEKVLFYLSQSYRSVSG